MEKDQMGELRELVEFLKENGVAEFDMERADLKVRLKFAGATRVEAAGEMAVSPVALASLPIPAHAGAEAQVPAASEDSALHEVKSPLVGTFYESASPGASPFVKVGDQIEAGQVLCIVEAMKLMNEVEADVAGELVQRIAVSGQPVEYGQPLFSIRPR